MWNRVSADEWQSAKRQFSNSLFFSSEFLDDIAAVYSLTTHFFLYKQKGKTLSAISFFSSGNRIITPVEFYYLPFWIQPNLSEPVYFEVVGSLAQLLKSDYRSIYFKLGVHIHDIRPFIWADFKIENKFTHLKVDHRSPHPSVTKNLRKSEVAQYRFAVIKPDGPSVQTNMEFLQSLGFQKSLCDKYVQLIHKWIYRGVLSAFNIYKGEKLICSNLVLLDREEKKAYQILLDNTGKEDRLAHTVLYSKLFEWCFENGFEVVDTCGANIRKISAFKSYFGTELRQYYKISYDSTFHAGEKLLLFLVKVVNKVRSILGF